MKFLRGKLICGHFFLVLLNVLQSTSKAKIIFYVKILVYSSYYCYSKIKIDLARISYIVKKMIFIAVSILTGGSFIEVFITRAFLTDFLVEK